MQTLTIKGVPDALYLRLKERAAEHRRSLNSEILVALEQAVSLTPPAAVRTCPGFNGTPWQAIRRRYLAVRQRRSLQFDVRITGAPPAAIFGANLTRDSAGAPGQIVHQLSRPTQLRSAGVLVALPEQVDDAVPDLRAYFDRNHRWFFGFFLATLIVSVAKDVILSGQLPSQTNLIFHAAFAAGCIAGIVARGRRSQDLIGIGFAVMSVAYIAMLFTSLR